MLALTDLILHEYPGHSMDDVISAPLARWFAMIPAIEARRGVDSGRGWIARCAVTAMVEAEAYIRSRYRIV